MISYLYCRKCGNAALPNPGSFGTRELLNFILDSERVVQCGVCGDRERDYYIEYVIDELANRVDGGLDYED